MAGINFAKQSNIEKKALFSPTSNMLIPSLIILACLAAYGGLFTWKKILDKNLSQVEAEIKAETEEAARKKFSAVYDFQARLDTAGKVLSGRHNANDDLAKVESLIIPTIALTSFSYGEGGLITLEAITSDYHAVARQIQVFKENKDVSGLKVDEGSVTKEEEGIKFTLSFTLKPAVSNN